MVEGGQVIVVGAAFASLALLFMIGFAQHLNNEESDRGSAEDTASDFSWVRKVRYWLSGKKAVGYLFFAVTTGVFVVLLGVEALLITDVVEAEESPESTSDGKVAITDDNGELHVTLTNSEANPSSPFVLVVPDDGTLFAEHRVYTYESLDELQKEHPVSPDESGYLWAVEDTNELII